MMLSYSKFQNNFYDLVKRGSKNESEFFDSLLIPFVSSLDYQLASIVNQGKAGDMIINHDSNNQKIVAYPDNYSKIIFKIGSGSKDEKYDLNTIILNLNIEEETIEFVIPYFGRFVVSKTINFKDDEQNYESIRQVIEFKSRQELEDSQQKLLFKQLSAAYDITLDSEKSDLFLSQINNLLKNADADLIKLLSIKIYDDTNLPMKSIYTKINNILKNQTQDSYYQILYSQDEMKKDVSVKNDVETSKEENIKDIFSRAANEKTNERSDNDNGSSSLFKQR